MRITGRYQEIESVTKYSNYYLGKWYTWLSTPITERAAAWGIHPNVLTLLSLAIAICGCVFVSDGSRKLVVAGALLLYLSYVLDWCDGQLARFTGKVSPFGGWLDQICDRLKETAYVFAITLGAVHQGMTGTSVWAWSFASLFFLFLLEYYSQMSRAIPSLEAEGVRQTAAAAGVTPIRPALSIRRVVIDFSIDEQYFVVVIGLLLATPMLTLEAVAVLAGLMAVYKPVKGWVRYYRSRRVQA